MFIQYKLPGYQFLAGIRGHGINTRKIRHQGVAVAADHTIFPVYGHTREIAYMLIRTGQLVKQGGFSTVLIASQGKGQGFTVRKGIFSLFYMIPSTFSKSRMIDDLLIRRTRLRHCILYLSNFNFFCICQTQGQFVTVYPHLHRISHRCIFHHRYLC